MSKNTLPTRTAVGIVLASVALLSACSSDDSASGSATAVAVTSSEDGCGVAPPSAPAGDVVFTVSNTGSQTTEFYLYESDGTTIAGEVENIGPGLTRDLSASLEQGTYVAACKPGMTGEGIRVDFEVTAAS